MKKLKIKNSSQEYICNKIVCVGKNYAAHAKEMGGEVPEFPIIFLKPSSVLINSGETVKHPEYSNDLQHEVELVLLIGKDVKNADDKEAEEAIEGFAVGLDMTLRDLQWEFKEKGNPWTLAKVFDDSAVISDIVLKKGYRLSNDERIYLRVNDKLRQESTLDKMILNNVEIIKFISSRMTLEKGDLIFTGTPEGVSKVTPGDKITAGIGDSLILETEII
ncbi:MAG: fumarylacetoacetate hydrolase family protein [Ignavibacteria bacterium]|jgi:5-carboxymethyl-2-hydroxymuconate isomerase